MDRELLARHTAVVRDALAADTGHDPAAFGTHALTIVPLPQARVDGGVLALTKTMGTGTVLAVEPGRLPWARAHAPEVHYHAMRPPFLTALAAEMSAAGLAALASGTQLGFTLGDLPGQVELPPGLFMTERGRDWMTNDPALIKEFDNALEGDVAHPLPLAALVLEREPGRPAAVAGIWDHWNDGDRIYEVGIDVAREFRGQGLATLITRASCDWIVARGRVPVYTCEATNVLSQRVAAACGFVPLWSLAGLRKNPLALETSAPPEKD
jgi:GNAT superfamily N-acetyltransferase